MMDFYSMEKIAYAKQVEDHKIAAAAHLADKANALRLARRISGVSSPTSFIRSLARVLAHPVTALVPSAPTTRAR